METTNDHKTPRRPILHSYRATELNLYLEGEMTKQQYKELQDRCQELQEEIEHRAFNLQEAARELRIVIDELHTEVKP